LRGAAPIDPVTRLCLAPAMAAEASAPLWGTASASLLLAVITKKTLVGSSMQEWERGLVDGSPVLFLAFGVGFLSLVALVARLAGLVSKANDVEAFRLRGSDPPPVASDAKAAPPPPPAAAAAPAAAPAAADRAEEDAAAARARAAVDACLAAGGAASTGGDEPHALVLAADLAGVAPARVFEAFWADGNVVASAASGAFDGGSFDGDGDAPRSFYPYFLEAFCANEGATATPWTRAAPRERRVDTRHPLTTSIRMPGLALAIPTVKTQRAFFDPSPACALAITESSRFDGIPYAAALQVETTWLFSGGGDDTKVAVFYRCVFLTEVLSIPRWIQRFCVAKTKGELHATYAKWLGAAAGCLEQAPLSPSKPRARSGSTFTEDSVDDADDPAAGPRVARSVTPPARRPPPPPPRAGDEPRSLDALFCGAAAANLGLGPAGPAPPRRSGLAKPRPKGKDHGPSPASSPAAPGPPPPRAPSPLVLREARPSPAVASARVDPDDAWDDDDPAPPADGAARPWTRFEPDDWDNDGDDDEPAEEEVKAEPTAAPTEG